MMQGEIKNVREYDLPSGTRKLLPKDATGNLTLIKFPNGFISITKNRHFITTMKPLLVTHTDELYNRLEPLFD